MGFTTAMKNELLDAAADGLAPAYSLGWASAHTGFPGDAGSNEVSGGSPAYARKAETWNAAAAGVLDNASTPILDIPISTEVQYIGYWSAVSAGTFLAWAMAGGGTVQAGWFNSSTDVITSDAHGLSDDDRVACFDGPDSVPTGLTQGTIYHVVSSTTDTFQLAATQGGTAINFTTDANCKFQKGVPETFGAQGTYQIDDFDLDLNS